ncbi:MAG: aromatic amino acid transaminase [Chlamydiota bacterium]|nr:aromatic amino acid transaminase [Chlamydiota bacterium]
MNTPFYRPPIPPDPIFHIGEEFLKDPREDKVDLTVGVYRDEKLQIASLPAVEEAAHRLQSQEIHHGYLPIGGDPHFLEAALETAFGEEWEERKSHLTAIQTPGGTGALRIGGEFLRQGMTHTLSLPAPTWPNHYPLFEAAGLTLHHYPYYQMEGHKMDLNKTLEGISQLTPNSAILFHGSCHNPSGCDPSHGEWEAILDIVVQRRLLPIFDCAYLGLGEGFHRDRWPLLTAANREIPFLLALSFSKNAALYGERVGALILHTKGDKEGASAQMKALARRSYSNPPRYGGRIIATLFEDLALKKAWHSQCEGMRQRIESMRSALIEALPPSFSFLSQRKGMFALLGLLPKQVEELATSHGIYLTGDGRINLTGLNHHNLNKVAVAIRSL